MNTCDASCAAAMPCSLASRHRRQASASASSGPPRCPPCSARHAASATRLPSVLQKACSDTTKRRHAHSNMQRRPPVVGSRSGLPAVIHAHMQQPKPLGICQHSPPAEVLCLSLSSVHVFGPLKMRGSEATHLMLCWGPACRAHTAAEHCRLAAAPRRRLPTDPATPHPPSAHPQVRLMS